MQRPNILPMTTAKPRYTREQRQLQALAMLKGVTPQALRARIAEYVGTIGAIVDAVEGDPQHQETRRDLIVAMEFLLYGKGASFDPNNVST
jgi:hypothetical protein